MNTLTDEMRKDCKHLLKRLDEIERGMCSEIYCKDCKHFNHLEISHRLYAEFDGYACYEPSNINATGYIEPQKCLEKNKDFNCSDFDLLIEEEPKEPDTWFGIWRK